MKLFAVLLALFVVVPVVEFTLLIEIGRRLGTLDTLILIFGTGIVGAYLARLEGFRVIRRIQRDLHAGIMPTGQLLDGVLVLIAGVVLLTPGLLTDIAGVVLLVPATRYPIKAFIRNRIRNRFDTLQIHLST